MQLSSISADLLDLGRPPSTAGTGLRSRLFAHIEERESQIVWRFVDHARRRKLIRVARAITRAGNGWLYPSASAMLVLLSFPSVVRCLTASGISLAVAFTIYPRLKRASARPRPYQLHPELTDRVAPLDLHSFPSGHAMTAAAFGVPMILAAPAAAAPIVIVGCALVSWSRIALGHHYVTDILAGTLIGSAIATFAMLLVTSFQ